MPSNVFVVLMGMGTVFFGLICIIILSMIMSKICQGLNAKSSDTPDVSSPVDTAAAPVVQNAPIQNRQAMIAAISAAIAEELGTDVSAIRIRSLKHVGGIAPAAAPAGNRRELIAAISAAIAEDLGTDVSGIRIHSLKHVGGAAPITASPSGRQELVAAVSAAIAEDLGTDISGIRIHSMKKIA